MFVTPAPVCLPVILVDLGKLAISVMVFLYIHTIGAIFMTIPLMIVIVAFVVIDNYSLGSQKCWSNGNWD